MIPKQSRPRKPHLEFIPGQVICRVEEPVVRPHVDRGMPLVSSEAKLLPDAITEPLDYLRTNAGLKSVRPIFSERRTQVLRAAGSARTKQKLAVLSSVADTESDELAGINVLTLDPKKTNRSLLRHVGAAKGIELIEPMPARWLAGMPAPDPRRNLQWGLRAIGWFEAEIPDASDVQVAVLDTGVDARHPDLKDVDMDYYHEGFSSQDLVGHGTHVSGIIGATVNDDVGISGICGCRLSVWKVFPDEPIDGEFYVDGESYLRALRGVELAAPRAVNLSLGGTARSATEELLFARLQRAGVVVVAAMGNEYQMGNPTEYPAAFEGVISVGAVDETRSHAPFSNTGAHIDLVAPGVNILSTLPARRSAYREERSYISWDGTSMATPHVAGAAALVAARFPEKTADELRTHLIDTATSVSGMRGRRRTQIYGRGLLDLKKALS